MADTEVNPPIFSGLLDDVTDAIGPPIESMRVNLVPEGSPVPNPRSSDVLAGVIGSVYETSIAAPQVSARQNSPQTESSIISSGLLATLKSVLGRVSEGAGLPLNAAANFAGRTTPFTLAEYEKLVLPKVKNLETNFNPLGFSPESFLTGLTLVQQLMGDLSEEQAKEKGAADAALFDQVRREIYDLNTRLEEAAVTITAVVTDELLDGLAEPTASLIRRYLYRYETLFSSNEVILPGSTKDQLIDVKSFLSSMVNAIRDAAASISADVEEAYEILLELHDGYAVLVTDRSDQTSVMLEDIRLLRKSYGEFVARGLDQQVNYRFTENDYSYRNLAFYSWLRRNFTAAGHTSVSKLATSFANRGKSLRDVFDASEGEAPTDARMATAGDGSGDRTQRSGKIDTVPGTRAVGPLDATKFKQYEQVLGQRESGNNYAKVNSIGFLGRWQFGADALVDLGYVRRGTSTRGLESDSAWTGKDGITSKKVFLGSTSVQDKCILEHTQRNYKTLIRLGVISTGSDAGEVSGYLMAAHLKGCGGARRLKNGEDNSDAYGSTASSYYALGKSAVGVTGGAVASTAAASVGGTTARQSNEAAAGSTTIPDVATIQPPMSQATPRYPYNSVREYEGGHVKEYDSTPGNERIQERHRTGTGYEVMSDGTYRMHVTNDRYTVIMGSDHIIVSGSVQISVKGDVGIRAEGNINLDAKNDLNVHVGGNYNLVVSGNSAQRVEGGKSTNVQGDSAENVGGFKKVGVTGDVQMEGASQSIIARDGDMSLAGKKKLNVKMAGDVSVQTSGSYTQNSKGKTTQTSEGDSTYSAKGATTVGSTGGGVNIAGDGGVGISSKGGGINLFGSGLKVNSQIERAIFANRAGVASSLGPAPTQTGTGTETPRPTEAQEAGDKAVTDKSKMEKTIAQFHPVKGDKTQGYAGGEDMSGYSDGIPEPTTT